MAMLQLQSFTQSCRVFFDVSSRFWSGPRSQQPQISMRKYYILNDLISQFTKQRTDFASKNNVREFPCTLLLNVIFLFGALIVKSFSASNKTQGIAPARKMRNDLVQWISFFSVFLLCLFVCC
jgi:hypothetical protein